MAFQINVTENKNKKKTPKKELKRKTEKRHEKKTYWKKKKHILNENIKDII